jgi:hypothetical protein
LPPKVLICGLAKDAHRWIPRNIAAIDGLDYPKELLSYSYVEGGSKDNTVQLLADWLVTKKKWTLRKCDMVSDAELAEEVDCRIRTWRSAQLCWKALDDEDYVFMCDSDVVEIPVQTLASLIEKDVDIIHPYLYVDNSNMPANWNAGKKLFYDSWAFRFRGVPWDNSSTTAVKMIDKADRRGLVEMDSIGFNPALIKRRVIDEVAYSGEADCLGFCAMAQRFGFKIYSMPSIECVHAWESI